MRTRYRNSLLGAGLAVAMAATGSAATVNVRGVKSVQSKALTTL